MTLLIDLSERSFENQYFVNSTFSAIKPIFSQKNIQIFDLFDTSSDVVKKIDKFQPEFIGGYPFAFIQLALLRNKGFGKNINPRCALSSGSYFDSYSRKFVEDALDTKIYDFYAATETGPIAFECKNGNYHVHSDLIYPEFIKNGEPVSYGEPGNLIITKLYGRGTPIIRYAGIDDLVTPEESCNCGVSGSIIKKIHGRKSDSIFLPDGKMALPSLIDDVFGDAISETKASKIRRIQIIQHKIDSLELKILFDEDLRNIGPSSEEIFSVLKRKLLEKFGSDIKLVIKEVVKFDKKDPYFITKIDRAKFVEKKYLV
jgi:phenylacetate-coenzyme A ligase PaaK-like adenylate-forming protein